MPRGNEALVSPPKVDHPLRRRRRVPDWLVGLALFTFVLLVSFTMVDRLGILRGRCVVLHAFRFLRKRGGGRGHQHGRVDNRRAFQCFMQTG